jgi:uncharacterized protein (DUF983 family)
MSRLCNVCRQPRDIHGYLKGEPICSACVSALRDGAEELLLLRQN